VTLICLFICVANYECAHKGLVNCGGWSPNSLCIDRTYLCDGHAICPHSWDENPANCGQFDLHSQVMSEIRITSETVYCMKLIDSLYSIF